MRIFEIGAKWNWMNHPSGCNGACSMEVITLIGVSSRIPCLDLYTLSSSQLLPAFLLNSGLKERAPFSD